LHDNKYFIIAFAVVKADTVGVIGY
jgi:hypothetical protein